jgi:dTDP-4-dehydrorhamnose reductase
VKVLLTGGGGQVGTETRKRLADFEVLAPTRQELDLSQPDEVAAALREHRPDMILSVGAYTAVDRAEDEPAMAKAVNGEAVAVMAEYCRAAGAPLIHVSTDYVFDGKKSEPYAISDHTCPLSVYGISKLAGERAAAAAPLHVILRVSWVFSAHGNNFVKTMLRLAATRSELNVVADQLGGPTWAGHIAETLAALVRQWHVRRELPVGIHHFSGAPYTSWYGFAQAIFDEGLRQGLLPEVPLLHAIPTSAYPTVAKRPVNSRLAMENIAVLGCRKPDWREGLRKTVSELVRADSIHATTAPL